MKLIAAGIFGFALSAGIVTGAGVIIDRYLSGWLAGTLLPQIAWAVTGVVVLATLMAPPIYVLERETRRVER